MSWNQYSTLSSTSTKTYFDDSYNSFNFNLYSTWSQNMGYQRTQFNFLNDKKHQTFNIGYKQDQFQELMRKIQKVKNDYQEDHSTKNLLNISISQKLQFKKKNKQNNQLNKINKSLRRVKTVHNLAIDEFIDKTPLTLTTNFLKTDTYNIKQTQSHNKQTIEFNVKKKKLVPQYCQTKQKKENLQNLASLNDIDKLMSKKQSIKQQKHYQFSFLQQKKQIHFDLNILNKIPVRQSINLDIEQSTFLQNLQRNQTINKNINHDILSANFKLNQLSQKQQLKISDFQLGNCIGSGKFGQVYLCKHKKTSFVCALKKILKSTIQQYKMVDQFMRQLKISYMVDHPNVIKTYGHFHDQFHVFLLMEFAVDGCVIDNLKFKKCQTYSSKVLFQTLNAIDHLHRNKIVHRDIKPQNIVVFFKDTFKICDFGLSAFVDNQMKTTFCGTADYLSPEMKDIGQYNTSVDLWSLGVLAYQLILGQPPFKQKISEWKKSGWKKSNYWTWKVQYPKQLSDKSISFMKGLLKQKPDQRQKIMNCLRHEYILTYNKEEISCIKSAQQTIFQN